MKLLLRLLRGLVRLEHGLENALLYALVALLLGLAIFQIGARNLFDTGLDWGDALLRVIVLWLSMVGAMIATRQGGHISIDVLSHYLSPALSAASRRVAYLFSAAVSLLAAWYCGVFVLDERAFGDVAFAGVPVWMCEAIIPVGLAVIGGRFLFQALGPAPCPSENNS